MVEHVASLYGVDISRTPFDNVANGSISLRWSTRLFEPESPTNKGDVWQGNTFHHAGCSAGCQRSRSKNPHGGRQESSMFLVTRTDNVFEIDAGVFIRLLRGWAPLVDAFDEATGAAPYLKAPLLRSLLP